MNHDILFPICFSFLLLGTPHIEFIRLFGILNNLQSNILIHVIYQWRACGINTHTQAVIGFAMMMINIPCVCTRLFVIICLFELWQNYIVSTYTHTVRGFFYETSFPATKSITESILFLFSILNNHLSSKKKNNIETFRSFSDEFFK